MVYIPAGSFLMGNSGIGDDATYGQVPDEYPPALRDSVSGYYIGKYDVTRGEYQQFMNAGGYSNSAYWSSAGWSWKVQQRNTAAVLGGAAGLGNAGTFTQTDSYPVVGVTYYEAEAFCNGRVVICRPKRSGRGRRGGPEATRMCIRGVTHGTPRSAITRMITTWGGYQAYQTSPVGSYPERGKPLRMHGYGWQRVAMVPGLVCVVSWKHQPI